jgi:hypothetical protein
MLSNDHGRLVEILPWFRAICNGENANCRKSAGGTKIKKKDKTSNAEEAVL